jgi:hypothetical protein
METVLSLLEILDIGVTSWARTPISLWGRVAGLGSIRAVVLGTKWGRNSLRFDTLNSVSLALDHWPLSGNPKAIESEHVGHEALYLLSVFVLSRLRQILLKPTDCFADTRLRSVSRTLALLLRASRLV